MAIITVGTCNTPLHSSPGEENLHHTIMHSHSALNIQPPFRNTANCIAVTPGIGSVGYTKVFDSS